MGGWGEGTRAEGMERVWHTEGRPSVASVGLAESDDLFLLRAVWTWDAFSRLTLPLEERPLGLGME